MKDYIIMVLIRQIYEDILIEEDKWDEDDNRMNVIAQNGNEGLHYYGLDEQDI